MWQPMAPKAFALEGTVSKHRLPTTMIYWTSLVFFVCMSAVAMADDANAGACKAELQKVGANAPPGTFIPSCTEQGFYSVQQNYGSTGQSWCVDPATGKEISGTKTSPGTPPVDCPPCLIELSKSLALSATGIVGQTTPSCDEQGHFTQVQSWGSTGQSWCADPITGKEIEGTKKGPGQGRPDCSG